MKLKAQYEVKSSNIGTAKVYLDTLKVGKDGVKTGVGSIKDSSTLKLSDCQ